MKKLVKNYTKIAMGILLLACTHEVAFAKNTNSVYTPIRSHTYQVNSDLMFDARISTGMQSVLGNEYVYYPPENRTASKLIWDTKSLAMMGIGGSLNFQNKYTFNVDYWFSISKADNKMTDYDWFVRGYEWTHRSIHSDTDVSSASMFDMSAEINTLQMNATTFSALIGYRQDSYAWKAYGGSFIYSINGFRNIAGEFTDGLLVLSYEQTWKSPYLGLKVDTQFTNLVNLHAKFIYAPSVSVEAIDHHHLREIKSIATFDNTTMYGINVGIDYKISNALTFNLNYHYQKFDTTTGNLEWIEKGKTSYHTDYAGVDLETSMFSIALNYQF